MSKIAFGYFALSYENQSLLDPSVPLLACPVLVIFPHSIAHFHSYFKLVIPVFLNLICIHLEIDGMPALTISFLFLSDEQLSALVSLLYPVVISLAK